MEVNLPTFLSHEISFNDPSILAAEFQKINENFPSLFQFMREETEKLRNQFIPSDHPNADVRDAYMAHFDSPNSCAQVKNTLEIVWSTKFESRGIEEKVDQLEERTKEVILRLEDIKGEFMELSLLQKAIKFHFRGRRISQQIMEVHILWAGVLEEMKLLYSNILDFRSRRCNFQLEKCERMIFHSEGNDGNTIAGQFRELLLQRQLFDKLANISRCYEADSLVFDRLTAITKPCNSCVVWLANELCLISEEKARIGPNGFRAIEVVLTMYDFDLGLDLGPDSDDEL